MFRAHGYDGASLALISEAVGLQKSSLYHRFPGGKAQMARAVLSAMLEQLRESLFADLHTADAGNVRERLDAVATGVGEFYDQGRRWCVLETMSLGGRLGPEGDRLLAELAAAWIAALAAAAQAAGVEPREARRRARDVLVELEGSLVLARVSDDPSAFRELIAEFPERLCR